MNHGEDGDDPVVPELPLKLLGSGVERVISITSEKGVAAQASCVTFDASGGAKHGSYTPLPEKHRHALLSAKSADDPKEQEPSLRWPLT
jgi:hypothetical protein